MKYRARATGACAAPAVRSAVLIGITDTSGVICAGGTITTDRYLIVKTFILKRPHIDTEYVELCPNQKSAMWTKQAPTISG